MEKVAKFNWVEITKEDVTRAIEKFLELNPEYPEPRSTFLVYDGKKLSAKHIRGMAYKEHYGVEISKADFGGGMETVKFFERLGFEVEYSKSSVNKIEKESIKTAPKINEKKVAEKPIVEKMIEPPTISEKKEKTIVERIVIPSKGVIEQKNALDLLMLVAIYAAVYSNIYSWDNSAFNIGNEKVVFLDLLYYSFITLTTTGYGDIVPVSYIAKFTSASESFVFACIISVVLINFSKGLNKKE